MIAALPKRFTLHGRVPGREAELGTGLTHYATGGTAVRMLDLETGEFRPSTLHDVYDCARFAEACEHLHVFNRTVVAGDISDTRVLDICSAYSLMAGSRSRLASASTMSRMLPKGSPFSTM